MRNHNTALSLEARHDNCETLEPHRQIARLWRGLEIRTPYFAAIDFAPDGGATHKNEIEKKYGHIQRAIAEASIAGGISAAKLCRLTPITSNAGNVYGALEALKYYGIAGWTASIESK
jgi:hypothetical protein